MDLKKFFINTISRESYEDAIKDILNVKKGGKKTRRAIRKKTGKTRRVKK
jgi:hypothetical protein